MRCNGSNWAVYSPGSWDGFRNDVWALWAGVIMRLEHHLHVHVVGGYVRYISPYIIIIIKWNFLLILTLAVTEGLIIKKNYTMVNSKLTNWSLSYYMYIVRVCVLYIYMYFMVWIWMMGTLLSINIFVWGIIPCFFFVFFSFPDL